ncbi:MAG: hypothetical protein M1838_004150 [Thelocarpon superellum]|nr:MAG: hypothetical protein M1838_004150 [Thelocarpon superellum]
MLPSALHRWLTVSLAALFSLARTAPSPPTAAHQPVGVHERAFPPLVFHAPGALHNRASAASSAGGYLVANFELAYADSPTWWSFIHGFNWGTDENGCGQEVYQALNTTCGVLSDWRCEFDRVTIGPVQTQMRLSFSLNKTVPVENVTAGLLLVSGGQPDNLVSARTCVPQ